MDKRKLFGTGLIILGIAFSIGIFFPWFSPWDVVSTFWPVVLIGIGIYSLIIKPPYRRLQHGIVLLVLGALLQAKQLDLIYANMFQIVIPVLLIWGGLSLFTKMRYPRRKHKRSKEGDTGDFNSDCREFGDVRDYNNDDDYPDINAVFASVDTINHSTGFRGGNVNVAFGEARIDLRDAELSDEPEVLDFKVVLGSAEVIVPREWNVLVKPKAVLGSVDNITRNKFDLEKPYLEIQADAILGSIKIMN